MADENWQQIRNVFDDALRQPLDKRAEFVAGICAGDKLLLAEVNSLLSAFDTADSFMETPAVTKVADIIEAETKSLKKGTCFGHYEIIRQIGSGGMGEVYLAEDKKLDRRVAVKILDKKYNRHDSNPNRFTQEAKAASALNHPNILVIHEIGESEDAHYIVSEFINGKTLREALKERALKLSEVLELSIQIANALCAAHEANIIHRDIKPENIMIRPDGFAKILDFGLAKLVERKDTSIFSLDGSAQNQTARGMILGTVNYMSPEQAKGARVDERTDIFSFGVLIYEMIAGRAPFAGDSNPETFANLINSEPPPFGLNSSNIPDELQRIVFKMLSKSRDERYRSMNDVLAQLKDIKANLSLDPKLEYSYSHGLSEAPVLPRTTGGEKRTTAQTFNSLSQSIRRHKPLAASMLIGLIAATAALGLYFYKTTNAAVSDKTSIAVLPVQPLTPENRDAIYELGIAELLILRLNAAKTFVVRPLSATRKYTDLNQDPIAAGKEQKVDYVLASNYQLADDKIRVTAQLFNVASGQIEETCKSEKTAGDVFAMQDAIAGEVGNKLLARFDAAANDSKAKRGTENEEAYRLYLQGENLTGRRGPNHALKAIGYFEQALKLDPNFARAYVGMASAYEASGNLGGGAPTEEYAKAKQAIEKALQIDPDLTEAQWKLASIQVVKEWNFVDAEKTLRRAIELEPNAAEAHMGYGTYLSIMGRFDEAIAEMDRAIEIDPAKLSYQRDRGRFLYLARRYDEAVTQFRRVIELDENFASAYSWLWLTLELKGDYEQAYESFINSRDSNDRENVEEYKKIYATSGWKGVRQRMLELMKQGLGPIVNHYRVARQCALLGEKEEALKYLNSAFERHHGQMVMINVEPGFDAIRDDPRFDELVRRVGLK